MGIVSLKQDDSVLQTAAPHCTLATLAVYHEHVCVGGRPYCVIYMLCYILCYIQKMRILRILVFWVEPVFLVNRIGGSTEF